MQVEMAGAVMLVLVGVQPRTEQAGERRDPQADQHERDRELEERRQALRKRETQDDQGAAGHSEGKGMPQAPGEAGQERATHPAPVPDHRGDRREMVGVERVAQAEDEPEQERAGHRDRRHGGAL